MIAPSTPTFWTDEDLDAQSRTSIGRFVEKRLGESSDRFPQHTDACRKTVIRVFRYLRSVDPVHPDEAVLRELFLDDEAFNSFRYFAGPPVSHDDLGVLVTRSTKRISKTAIKKQKGLAVDTFNMVLRLIDHDRFPWLAQGRKPSIYQIKNAVRATASLQASQVMQTERRGYGRAVEDMLVSALERMGYTKVPAPNKGSLTVPAHFPKALTFYGECSLHRRRSDLVIGLHDGRIVAVECKDSNSVANSVKRVLNDTAAKAAAWKDKMGETVVPVAFLSGVFGLGDLVHAQSRGLYIAWAHNLDEFTGWLRSMHPDEPSQ